jgi:hypothetical protein
MGGRIFLLKWNGLRKISNSPPLGRLICNIKELMYAEDSTRAHQYLLYYVSPMICVEFFLHTFLLFNFKFIMQMDASMKTL